VSTHATMFGGFARTIGWDWTGLDDIAKYLGWLRDYDLLTVGDIIALLHDHLMDLSDLLNSQPLVYETQDITGAIEVADSTRPPCSVNAASITGSPSYQTDSGTSNQLNDTLA